MKIDMVELRSALIRLLTANMVGDADGGAVYVDESGAVLVEDPSRSGGKRWLHTIFEVKLTDEEFHLLVNPKLNFRQEIDLMDEEIPDTVEETVDFLWEDISAGVEEYLERFNVE